MNAFWGIALVLVVVTIVGGIVVGAVVHERRRREGLAAVAPGLGFDFRADRDDSVWSGLSALPLFSRGHSREAFNVMRGSTRERRLAVFDYRYVIGHGKNRHVSHLTVAHVQLPGARLPAFSLRRETVFDKMGDWIGIHDIDFAERPVFSKQWRLRGGDEAAVRALFELRVLDYFEQQDRLCVEADGEDLVVFRTRRVAPDELRALVSDALFVAELLTRDGTRARS